MVILMAGWVQKESNHEKGHSIDCHSRINKKTWISSVPLPSIQSPPCTFVWGGWSEWALSMGSFALWLLVRLNQWGSRQQIGGRNSWGEVSNPSSPPTWGCRHLSASHSCFQETSSNDSFDCAVCFLPDPTETLWEHRGENSLRDPERLSQKWHWGWVF